MGCFQFFFQSRQSIYKKYEGFFGISEDEGDSVDEVENDEPSISPLQTISRFYWSCLMALAQEDITKVDKINKQSLVLCLNYLSMVKDRNEQQKREMDKIKNRTRR